jgi:hypothetical protein
MVFNATFNNISVMLWQSVLLVEETGVPVENHQPATSHMLYPVHLTMNRVRTHSLIFLFHFFKIFAKQSKNWQN